MSWENWINLTVWKFTHLIQSVLQKLRRINRNKCVDSQVHDDATPATAQLPTKFIDCLSLQGKTTETITDEPSKSKANQSPNIVDMPVIQLSPDQSPSDTHGKWLTTIKT